MFEEYSRARREKDRYYDGRFFFGVTTTGIFCRPSCPSPTAREENVEYFETVFGALDEGYRPCLRCRPDVELDHFHGTVGGVSVVDAALRLIYDGYLDERTVEELAGEVGVSERSLRRLFVENVGAPPVKIAGYHRALFAKRLLLASERSITDVAFAAGYGSLRQFNDAFKRIFGRAPSEVRKRPRGSSRGENAPLLLRYTPPFDFAGVLAFLRPRAVRGVEVVTADSYQRTFRTRTARGHFTVRDRASDSALELTIVSDDVTCFREIHNRVRRMFDLDTDFTAINERFARDELLAGGMEDGHVPRLPVAFEPFEFMVRAILGQQITVKAATTLAGRIAERAGDRTDASFPDGLDCFFPSADTLAAADLEGLGLTAARMATVQTATRAVIDGTVSLAPTQSFESFREAFVALKGVGDWTANYVGMRGLGMRDSFPAGDLGVVKAMTVDGRRPTTREIIERSQRWRPYRAYAALCLWNATKAG